MRFCIAISLLVSFAGISRNESQTSDAPASSNKELGEIEIARASGQDAIELLAKLCRDPNVNRDSSLDELLCWRLLAGSPADQRFKEALVRLLEHPAKQVWGHLDPPPILDNPTQPSWSRLFRLVLAGHQKDRAALLELARMGKATYPDRFPGATAEKTHFDALIERGWSQARAGMEVIRCRSFAPLEALRDLDRALTREAEFFTVANRPQDAKALLDCRSQLRDAYLRAAVHVIERLFALNLRGELRERDELLRKVAALPYLQDAAARKKLFASLSEAVVWSRIAEPLLKSEVAFVSDPPDFARNDEKRDEELTIEAKRRDDDDEIRYSGDVRAKFGRLNILADEIVLHRAADGSATLIGSGHAGIAGIPGIKGDAVADRFTFSTDQGGFTLGGSIRIRLHDGERKLLACTINRQGELTKSRSLIDDFRRNVDTDYRLSLLPKIAAVFADDELPADVSYWMALHVLRPHLTWHAPYLPPKFERPRIEQAVKRQLEADTPWRRGDTPWQPAHGGEYWMLADVSDLKLNELNHAIQDRTGQETPETIAALAKHPGRAGFFWRIRDPKHADVERVLRLLARVKDGDYAERARRWATEIRRNNTVLTLDITGSYGPGRDAPVVLDVRNTEKVTVSIYRAGSSDDLLWVADRIGNDFIFRDHGLQYIKDFRVLEDLEKATTERRKSIDRSKRRAYPDPAFLKAAPQHRWTESIADLKVLSERSEHARHWRQDNDDEESEYFDDDCFEFRDRLDRTYRPEGRVLSTWQCERVLNVPGRMLNEPGAYIVAVEANGQTAYAPLLVDPLSLALKRCRDGVFAAVHDVEGFQPVKDAKIAAREMFSTGRTDTEGAAFAKVFAAGTRAIVAEKDGRFAIGGFGRVFEGIYKTTWEVDHERFDRLRLERRAKDRPHGQLYEDRFILAAYTDRPTYRPGQRAQFKLLVRQLAKGNDTVSLSGFRADDFDIHSRLIVPEKLGPVTYALIDSRGRVVAEGSAVFNEFGTSAGSLDLNAEAATGAYTLRVRFGKDRNEARDRLVPGIFSVQYYRRPNFDLKVSGVPEQSGDYASLKLRIQADYYFGKPVSDGLVTLTIRSADSRRPLAERPARTNARGSAAIDVEMPKELPSGKYQLLAALTDSTGRTVQKVLPFEIRRKNDIAPALSFAGLPRFIPIGKTFTLKTAATQIVAEQGRAIAKQGDSYHEKTFPVRQGMATLEFSEPGWYSLTAGNEISRVFVFGGKGSPDSTWMRDDRRLAANRERPILDELAPAWVNISLPGAETIDEAVRDSDREHDLFALFDKHDATVGGTCRVLVYVPYDKARLVFTIDGYSVRDYHAVTVNDSANHYHVVDVPIRTRHLPHFYLAGHIIHGTGGSVEPELRKQGLARELKRLDELDDGIDPRWRRIDVADLRRRPRDERLGVDVQPDHSSYKPGEKVNVAIRVVDAAGKAAEAEVSLSAVDESIYTFGEDRSVELANLFNDPHPAERLQRMTWRGATGRRWKELAERSRDQLKKQIEALQAMQMASKQLAAQRELTLSLSPPSLSPLALDGMLPVGQIPLARLRSDFRETAAWLPQLRTDANGKAHAEFTLPDTLTRYRLTAVAVNKKADVGTAWTSFEARMPLSVQLILPRFAVENDRFTAHGLIHNNTAREQRCEVVWELNGVAIDEGDATEKTDAVQRVNGTARIGAGESKRVAIDLVATKAGNAAVALHCTGATVADAETRSLMVSPLGREREVVLEGSFTGMADVQLPPGFEPRDVRVLIARGDVARAFEGVAYLIDYPYGCVEQTMSRFLPAVVIREASRRAPLHLPADVAAKLPRIYAEGLARLYRFQHADGGWGWWEHDVSHDGMTTYVVQGLSLCKQSGVPGVDAGAIERGCSYLSGRLHDGKLDGIVAAKAWNALALVGTVDLKELAAASRRIAPDRSSHEERAILALACRRMGLRDEADRLARGLTDWKSTEAEALALRLQVRLSFNAPLAECRACANSLLQQRTNGRWSSTQATAAAILALADYAAYTTSMKPAKEVSVQVDGKEAAALHDPDALAKLVYRLDVPSTALQGSSRSLKLTVGCDEPVLYTVVARGVERLDKIEPRGDSVRIMRKRETLDGKPIERSLEVGEVCAVRLTIDLDQPRDFMLIEDRRPMNCEFADEQATRHVRGMWANTEFRDDRVCLFFTRMEAGKHEIVYYLRAETPGSASILPGFAYPMYSEQLRGETGSDRIEVKRN